MKRFISIISLLLANNHLFANNSFHDTTKVIELNEVVVLGKTSKEQLIHFYKTNQASTLEDILGRLPELSFVRRGAYGMEPSIRSFSGGQINVLIDGMRIHGACTDKMDPATIYIEPMNLQNLQLQTSSNGFTSGSSIGGTINMKMAEADFSDQLSFKTSALSGYQSAANSFFESLVLNVSNKKWAIRLNGTYRNSSNYKAGNGSVIPFTQYEKTNYALSVKYRRSAYTYLKLDYLGDDGWNIGYPALPMDVGFASAKIASISLNYENFRKRFQSGTLKIYANTIRHYMDDTKRPNIPMHMDMPGYSTTAGFMSQATLKLFNNHLLHLSADGSATYLKASMTMYAPGEPPMFMLTWPNNRKIQSGISALWNIPVDSNWSAQLAARIDYFVYELTSQFAKEQTSILGYPSTSRKNLLKNSSVRITRNVPRNFRISAGISYSERMPTASELYGFYLYNKSDNHDYIGNLLLKPEHSYNTELSTQYLGYKTKITITGFYNKVSNYIYGMLLPGYSAMTIGASGVKSYTNLSSATFAGIETTVLSSIRSDLLLTSALKYIHAEKSDRTPVPFISPIKNITSLRYQKTNYSIQLEYEAAAQQKKIDANAGEDKTPGYQLIHLRGGYNFNIKSTTLLVQTGIENLFNKFYHDHLDWGNIARPGRNLYIQLKVSW